MRRGSGDVKPVTLRDLGKPLGYNPTPASSERQRVAKAAYARSIGNRPTRRPGVEQSLRQAGR